MGYYSNRLLTLGGFLILLGSFLNLFFFTNSIEEQPSSTPLSQDLREPSASLSASPSELPSEGVRLPESRSVTSLLQQTTSSQLDAFKREAEVRPIFVDIGLSDGADTELMLSRGLCYRF